MLAEQENTENIEEAESSQEQEAVETTEQTEEQPGATDEQKAEDTETSQKTGGQKAINKRFAKMTADKYAYKTKAEKLEEELNKLKAQQAATVQREPTLEQFDYDEEAFIKAKIDYGIAQQAKSFEDQQRQLKQEQAQKQREADFFERARKANIEGYSEAVTRLASSVIMPSEMLKAIQIEEKGPEIAFYLANNLDVADKIASSDPISGALEIGKLAAKLSNPKTKAPSKAPPPPKTLAGGGLGNKKYEDMSMEEIMKSNI